jgi:UDP-glucuronate 4-epimerase
MKDKKILLTGATGQVGRPIAELLARNNELWCAARFSEPSLRLELEAIGAKTFQWELGSSDFRGLPVSFDYCIHSAWNIHPVANQFEAAIESNIEGTALLMNHCRNAKAFLFISSLIVYRKEDGPQRVYKERGEAYGNATPFLPTYSVTKFAGEALVRGLSRMFSLPSTIARLGLGCGHYGHGGVAVRLFGTILAGAPIYVPQQPQLVSMIHEDDIAGTVEPLLKAAAVPSTVVNWVGDEVINETEIYSYLGELAGVEPKILVDEAKSIPFFAGDPSLRKSITGPNRVSWKVGLLKALRIRYPDHRFPEA